jgi:hypothetical protein
MTKTAMIDNYQANLCTFFRMNQPRRTSYGYDDERQGKTTYWSPPYAEKNAETIQVVQPRDDKPNYSLPKAMIPSILMILFGGVNFVAFLTFAVFSLMFHTEFFVAAVVYLVTGIVGVVASLEAQRLKAVVLGLLAGGVASFILGISQVRQIRKRRLKFEYCGFLYLDCSCKYLMLQYHVFLKLTWAG